LDRAESILTPLEAAKNGIVLEYMNTGNVSDPKAALMDFSGGKGFDDVLVFAPVASVVELADGILAEDGCLNFFAGPSDPNFAARFNFYNVHYAGTHVVGTSGGNTDDMKECLDMMAKGLLDPAILVTHIGGLNCVPEATLNLPNIPGGKKLIYTGIDMPLTAIADFGKLGETDSLFARLHEICQRNNGLWSAEAEKVLLNQEGK
jgi:threonine dehydrogenase-like Zn-dependent dehydrogenase